MTFDELPMYEAIHDVYREVDAPRSEKWIVERADELCRLILSRMPIYDQSAMLHAWCDFGKSQTVGDNVKKLALTVMVARTHGRRCFWADRGKGDCSDEVTLDRLKAGGAYTVENCVISCSRHNSSRSDRTVEEYLSSSE